MSTTVRPFLMFEGNAEAAMRAWVALVPGSRIVEVQRYGPGGPAPEGTVMRGVCEIAGQVVQVTDSFVHHAFTFTPSFSFFVECDSDAQIDALWAAMLDGGSALMEIGNYGFSRRFGWLNDRFGVSWQLNLA